MAQKITSELALKLTQQVSGPAAEARKALSSVEAAMAAIARKREADQRMADLALASEKARAKVRELANAMAATDAPSKKMQGFYAAAAGAADRAARQMALQKAVMASAQRSLTALVPPTEKLAAAEARLGREVELASQKMIRAAAEESRAARMRRSWLAETTRAANEQAAANRRAAAAQAEANRRMAEGALARRAERLRVVASAAVGVGAAGRMLAAPVQKAMAYEQQLTYMASTMAGGGTGAEKQSAYKKISDAINAALISGGGKREDAAGALNTVVASGQFSDGEAIEALGPVVKTAHAAGASADDIAKTAVAMRMAGVSIKDMQSGFDMMLRGGQLGMFELRDMAKWLPQQLALAKGAGLSGLDAIRQLVALNQVSRTTAGTTDAAGNNLVNLLQKLNSKELQGTMAKVVKPEVGDPSTPGAKKKGKSQPHADFDWQGYMIQQQKKGVTPLEAFGNVVDRQMKNNKEYQSLRNEIASSKTPEERRELLDAAGRIAEASELGKFIADREALTAALALFYGKEKRQEIDKQLGNAGGTVQAESDFVRSQTWSKAQDVQNAADRANETAYDSIKGSLSSLSDRVTEAARALPGFTAGIYGAAQVFGAIGGGATVGGLVAGFLGGRAAGAAAGAAAAGATAVEVGAGVAGGAGGAAAPAAATGGVGAAASGLGAAGLAAAGLAVAVAPAAAMTYAASQGTPEGAAQSRVDEYQGQVDQQRRKLESFSPRGREGQEFKQARQRLDLLEGNLAQAKGELARLKQEAAQVAGGGAAAPATPVAAPAEGAPGALARMGLPAGWRPSGEIFTANALANAAKAHKWAAPPQGGAGAVPPDIKALVEAISPRLVSKEGLDAVMRWRPASETLREAAGLGSARPGGVDVPAPMLPQAGPIGEKAGAELGAGIAQGLERQSSLTTEHAQQIMASVQAIFAEGVVLPIRIDTSAINAGIAAAHARANESQQRQARAMLRATYADTEMG